MEYRVCYNNNGKFGKVEKFNLKWDAINAAKSKNEYDTVEIYEYQDTLTKEGFNRAVKLIWKRG